jgi:sugar lactone lactonase YvrE
MKKIYFYFAVLSLVAFATLNLISCADTSSDLPEPPVSPTLPLITGLSTDIGRIGTPLMIYGTNFVNVADAEPGSTYTNTSIIKFNGTLAISSEWVSQDANGKQSMDTYVPEGASSGKVTITIDGITATSPNDFIVTAPIYEPPVITGFSPNSRVIGNQVWIDGNNFVPPVPVPPSNIGARGLTNTSIVKFNGIIAEAYSVYQDSIGKQSMAATVPEGATTGKITVTANGTTASSQDNFIVTIPMYVPNVTVSTLPNIGGTDVAIDADGNLYVPTNDDFKIYKIAPDGTFVIFAETYNGPNSGQPLGIAVDSDGNVYATVGNKIQKITPDGTRSVLAGGDDFGYADGQGTNAKFRIPIGIDVDANGNVYVADALNNVIRKITQPDGTVTTLAGGTEGYADAQGPNAKFNLPMDVAVDATGNVFVSDAGNNKIRKITPIGEVTTVAGSSIGFLDGPVATAQFDGMWGIAVDTAGYIYVGDSSNLVVRRISLAGNGKVTTVAGSTPGELDGPGNEAQFRQISGITVDASGAIYVSQSDNGRIRKIIIN